MRTHRRARAGAVLVAVVAASASAIAGPDVAEAVRSYATWTRVTRTPYAVAPAVAVLCAPATGAPMPDPHAGAVIDVFVNDAGRTAMATHGPVAFPVGSVIVKEKRAAAGDTDPTLLTVMIKRPAGYNASAGDWEFAVLDGTGSKVVEHGTLERCIACHARVPSSDFVFRTYLDAPN